MSAGEHLVVYDYGMGGLWAVVVAQSEREITNTYPELAVVSERPGWMTEQEYEELRADALQLDTDPPTGILAAIVAGRSTN